VAIEIAGAPDGREDAVSRSTTDALIEELARLGAKPVRLDDDPTVGASAHARTANEMGASLCLSISLVSPDAGSTGPMCSFFGSASTHSPAGMQLAELILEELERVTGRAGGTKGLTGAILRETRMPAVQIEPLSRADDPAEIADPGLPVRVAAAIATGVRRFFAD